MDAQNSMSTASLPDPYDVRVAPLPASYVSIAEVQDGTRWSQDYRAADGQSMKEWTNIQVLAKGLAAPTDLVVECTFGAGEMAPPAGARLVLSETDPATGLTASHDLTDGSQIAVRAQESPTEQVV